MKAEFDSDYFEENPVPSSEKRFRSMYCSLLDPVLERYPEIRGGRGKTALDVGCAFGFGAKILREWGYSVVGIDVSSYAVERARSQYSECRFFVHDSQEEFSFSGVDEFDLIQGIDVIEHTEKPRKVLGNMYEALSEDGFLLIVTPNRHSPYHIFFDGDDTHINVKSPSEWMEILSEFDWQRKDHFVRQYVPLAWEVLDSYSFFNLPRMGKKIIFLLKK